MKRVIAADNSISTAILAFLISFINTICTSAVELHIFFWRDAQERLDWILAFLIFWAASFSVIKLADLVLAGVSTLPSEKETAGTGRKMPFSGLPAGALGALLMFFCWLPYLLAYSPGLVNYDTVNQVLDVFNGVSPVPFGFVEGQEEVTVFLNAHHPVFVSLLFAGFIRLGQLFGDPSRGLFLYILCQMALAAVLFSWSCGRLVQLGVSRVYTRILYLFFALFPPVPYYVCNMLKNSLHSILFVPWFMLYLLFAVKAGHPSRRDKVLFIVLSVFLCLTQNTGIYLVLLSAVVLLFTVNKKERPAIATYIGSLAVIFMILLPKILYPAFNIFPGGKQELLGTLFQQTARYVREYEEEVTPEEKEVISRVLDYDALTEKFEFGTSDPIKATYHLHVTRQEMMEYYKLWLRMGIRHPGTYFRATFPICGSFFTADSAIGIFDHIPSDEGIWAQIRHVRDEYVRDTWTANYWRACDLPGISLLFRNAMYTLWLPLYAVYRMLRTGRKKELLSAAPLVVCTLFLIVSPMMYSRYALSHIFAAPFFAVYAAAGKSRE